MTGKQRDERPGEARAEDGKRDSPIAAGKTEEEPEKPLVEAALAVLNADSRLDLVHRF